MSTTNSDFSSKVEPKRMELSLNELDGSLQASTLSQVVLAVTDQLYNDVYTMVQGEMEVALPSAPGEEEQDASAGVDAAANNAMRKSERMANLSFVQRRHELAWRLAANAKRVQMTCALTGAAAATDLGTTVRVCTTALQQTRTAWIQADEAQDALYFFHGQLFAGRAAPHDVYGASDILLRSMWYDVPSDVRLIADRYETSLARMWSKEETEQRWQLAVRNKLLRGEVAEWRRQKREPLWSISLTGGIVKLTHGNPKRMDDGKDMYPVEALLTVLPSPTDEPSSESPGPVDSSAWSLLSITVNVKPKTGEFDHQLVCSNRQRYDLHRLAMLAMNRAHDAGNPLETLFNVSNSFLLQWQLEVLSAQAQALRRGVWSAGTEAAVSIESVVYDPKTDAGSMSIAFWKVDDAYGAPSFTDLQTGESVPKETTVPRVQQQLQLWIRADTTLGLRVALSGGVDANSSETALLVQATSHPLALSASDALLAATKLCAARKCEAAVAALQDQLPPWIHLTSDNKGIIAVAASITYYGADEQNASVNPVLLFHIRCDLRTGTFVNTFPRSMHLLRRLSSNESQASLPVALRLAALPETRRRTAASNSTGRVVRDIMDTFLRSMNLLGRRVGVGGRWEDIDGQSSLLRSRSIHSACQDVRKTLINCCGAVALYGLVPLAYSTAFGLDGVPDL